MKNLKRINWKRMLLDNWVLKLASLTVAFVLWFVVATVDNPIEDKTFYNIKVNLLNTGKLTDAGMIVEVLEGSNILRSVTFEAPKSVRDVITESDIIAEADLDNLTYNNTVEIQFSCPKYAADVTHIEGNIDFVKLNIEQKISKWIDIEERIVGEVADGYMVGNVTLDRNRLEIEGPESKINQITKAIVDVNVAEINSDISTTVDVYFLDADGKTLRTDSVKQNVSTVTARVDVLTIKEIPIHYIPIGEVAEGYLPTGEMETELETVLVAGNAPTIDQFTEITISDELDMTDMTESLVKEINLKNYLPSGVVWAERDFDGKADVTVFVEEEVEKTIQLRRNSLQIVGVPDNVMAQVVVSQEMPSLRVSGLAADMQSITESTMAGIIDVAEWMNRNEMTEIPPGVHNLPVGIELAEGQNVKEFPYVQVQFSLIEEGTDTNVE